MVSSKSGKNFNHKDLCRYKTGWHFILAVTKVLLVNVCWPLMACGGCFTVKCRSIALFALSGSTLMSVGSFFYGSLSLYKIASMPEVPRQRSFLGLPMQGFMMGVPTVVTGYCILFTSQM